MAVVKHRSVPVHSDVMNNPGSSIHLLSWSCGELWIETTTGSELAPGRNPGPARGVTVNLGRAIHSFSAFSSHALSVAHPDPCLSLVLYTTRRTAIGENETFLSRHGFPLPARALAPRDRGSSARGADDPDIALVDDLETAPASPIIDVSEPFNFTLSRVNQQGQPALRASPIDVEIMHGATVGDLRTIVKKCLRLHPSKLLFRLRGARVALREEQLVWPIRKHITLAVLQQAVAEEDDVACHVDEEEVQQGTADESQESPVRPPSPAPSVASAAAFATVHPPSPRPTPPPADIPAIRLLAQRARAAAGSLITCLDELDAALDSSDVRVGGGASKVVKLPKHTLNEIAVKLVGDDLNGADACTPGRLIQHIIQNDNSVAKAVYQSQTSVQRLTAMAAAFHRAGLEDRASHFRLLASQAVRNASYPADNCASKSCGSNNPGSASTNQKPPKQEVDLAHGQPARGSAQQEDPLPSLLDLQPSGQDPTSTNRKPQKPEVHLTTGHAQNSVDPSTQAIILDLQLRMTCMEAWAGQFEGTEDHNLSQGQSLVATSSPLWTQYRSSVDECTQRVALIEQHVDDLA
eukprot:6490289-Amphidinium_carterae.1